MDAVAAVCHALNAGIFRMAADPFWRLLPRVRLPVGSTVRVQVWVAVVQDIVRI